MTIVLTPGNDVFAVSSDFMRDSVLGNGGTDLFVLSPQKDWYPSDLVWGDVILDFDPGPGGDAVRFGTTMRDAFWKGELEMVQSGGDVVFRLFTDVLPFDSFVTYKGLLWTEALVLRGVTIAELTAENFAGAFDPQNSYADMLRGGSEANLLSGGFGDDDIAGRGGDDTLWGGAGRDTLNGGDGDDVLAGGFGDDLLSGGAGDDRIVAGVGNDKIFGGSGNDVIAGGDERDTLFGGDGNDRLDGGQRNDRVLGEAGNDTLRGGSGDDTMAGGAGNDVFVLDRPEHGNFDRDVILDFTQGADRIDARAFGITDASLIARNLSSDARGEAVIEYHRGFDEPFPDLAAVVTLVGVQASALTAADFLF